MIRLVATYPAGNTRELTVRTAAEAKHEARRLLRNAQWVEVIGPEESDPIIITAENCPTESAGPDLPTIAA